MGYSTDFTGQLSFTSEVTASQLAMLKKILGEDVRDHEWWHALTPSAKNLEGQLVAQGEDAEDRWLLVMVDGKAEQREVALTGTVVVCPHCGEKFALESST